MKIRAILLDGRILERDLPVAADVLELELPGEERRTLRRTKDTANGATVYREVPAP